SGLDVYAGAFTVLQEQYGDRFSPPRSLTEKVAAGDLGLKTSGGYRAIPDGERTALESYRDRVFVALTQLQERLGPPPGLSDPSGLPATEQQEPAPRHSAGGKPRHRRRPRLIHLNGPAGIGKSTLAERW